MSKGRGCGGKKTILLERWGDSFCLPWRKPLYGEGHVLVVRSLGIPSKTGINVGDRIAKWRRIHGPAPPLPFVPTR